MNLFQLVFKQMRQRALSTWLTILSVLLGVALAISTLVILRESEGLFIQSDYGYDLIVGPKASDIQVVLNTIYHIGASPGTIPWTLYTQLQTDPRYTSLVEIAVPYIVGDSVEDLRAVGTTPELFGFDNQDGQPLTGYDDHGKLLPEYQSPWTAPDHPTSATRPLAAPVIGYRAGHKYELSSGRMFHPRKFEAVVGADVPRLLNKSIGDTFQITHGLPNPDQTKDIHDETWTIVGILEPTHTANDRVLFVPAISYFAIGEHGEGLAAQAMIHKGEDIYASTHPSQDHDNHDAAKPHPQAAQPDHDHAHGPADASHHDHAHHAYSLSEDGQIQLDLPQDQWRASAILVKSRGGVRFSGGNTMQLLYLIRNSDVASAVAPGQVMKQFFDTFLKPSSSLLLLISVLVTVVATVGILVSIYNSVSARLREIAILRALGATRARVLSIICLEAACVGIIGSGLGLLAGHLVAAGVSQYFTTIFGQGFNWLVISGFEWLYLLGVVGIALLAGLVPAIKAYRTPVASNLVVA